MSRRRRLMVAWALLCFGLAVRALGAGLLPPVETVALRAVALDLNRARVEELALLPGLGRRRAEAIVLHRIRWGPFRSVAALAEVDGCGEITANRLAEEFGVWCSVPGSSGADGGSSR